ncbi:MAG: anthranilate synthase component I family protein [Elusimicrobiota bacterium]|jgi:anthranilate synthase component 1|nr:anthranilate synthase component I family protein [Elusimicrobiota bacterium]
MIRPSIDEAKAYLKDWTIVPICKELFADIKTSVEILKNLIATGKKCYMLESVESAQNWGRYSFLGYDPKLSIQCNDNKIIVKEGNKLSEVKDKEPIVVLREILSQYKSPKIDYMPPFTGGLVGFFSYDFAKYIEKSLILENKNAENFDDFNLMLFDKAIAIDHFKQKIFIIINVPVKNFENNYVKAIEQIYEMETLLKSAPIKESAPSALRADFSLLHSKEKFMDMVKTIQKHIYEGDIFQAVISNRQSADFDGGLLQTYRVLRTTNPSPYMFYLNFGDTEIAGTSPETLVTLKNKELVNYALAGTCPRGKNSADDERLIAELLKDEKERSEHNMLVDLARNDLGKISEFGSVQVAEYMKIVRFSHVCHIASTIVGKMKDGYDQLDALGAVLPAGTLSGAPKKRACEIINSLEGYKRGVYGGAIGYIDFSGNMDTCIAIRMAVVKDRKVFVQAGAGIVADSRPEKEFNECNQKAKAIIGAIKTACGDGDER